MLKRTSLGIALLVSICLAGQSASAQDDLGSRWPNTADVSLSPYWHVYIFHRAGVEYVQVNDLSGNVRQAVATSNGNFLILPIGSDVSRVATSQRRSSNAMDVQCEAPNCGTLEPQATASGQVVTQAAQLVYRDSTVTVTLKKDANGNPLWQNAAATCGPPDCGSVNQQPIGH